MKICPQCHQTYADENLNFCLNDGELLARYGDDAPPTVFMDPARVTNQTGWEQPSQYSPPAPWRGQPTGVQNNPYGPPASARTPDQTLPTVSLVLGVLSLLLICCYGGFPLGLAAIITGFIGMKNADKDPASYGGRGLAIGGMVLGIISLLSSIVFVLFAKLFR